MRYLLKCDHCREPIGVYEPAVFVVDQHVHRTSEAAHPELAQDASERYHRACYAAVPNGERASACG